MIDISLWARLYLLHFFCLWFCLSATVATDVWAAYMVNSSACEASSGHRHVHSDWVSPMHSAVFHQHSPAYCPGLPGLGTSQLVGVLAMCWFPQVWRSRLTVQPGFWWWQCSKKGGPCYLVAHWYSRTWSHFTKTPGWIHTFYKTWGTL